MRNRVLFWLLLGGGAFILLAVVALSLILAYGGEGSGDFAFGNRIQVVDIEGELVDSRPIIEQLKRYEDAKSVPAILLNVDSPGGGVAASQEIYTEVKRLREKKNKVVVAYMSSVGASGAYYLSAPADKIIANPGTIVGSIGVIAEWVNYGDLLAWAKLRDITFKTGEFKDTGSPTRELTEREKVYFQGLIDDMYVDFVEAVAAGRKMDMDAVRALADGRVFTGRDAREKKLVDEIGNFQDAVDLTASLAGIEGKPNLLRVTRQRVTLIDLLTGDVSGLNPFGARTLKSQVRFQYLWK
ncbi:MAG TPA: signal peptide peptidase SppA [Terriglobia bacterium]|nr:signal peptide peptidase SppA [Terriglobia bacterium]